MRSKNRRVLPRHKITFVIIRFVSLIYTRIFLGFRCKDRYKIKKGETVVVLSNHQTDADPFCIFPSFIGKTYPVGTDYVYTGRFKSKVLKYFSEMIPKRKGTVDKKCMVAMFQTISEGGSLILFPEGNRTYAEFQFYVTSGIAKLIKKFGSTLILYNFYGGTGVSPRFAKKRRKGPFTGKIVRVIKKEEYENYSDEELYQIIIDAIRVYDSESGNLYKSKDRAEYLERMFFVCPKCKRMETLRSNKNVLSCSCGFELEYLENLLIKTNQQDINFDRLVDYWNYQKKYLRDLVIEDNNVIFKDNITLYETKMFENKRKVYKGLMFVDKDLLHFNDLIFHIREVENASVISGDKLSLTISKTDYLIVGEERFNPLKYVFLFNKLNTNMKENNTDKYYTLED